MKSEALKILLFYEFGILRLQLKKLHITNSVKRN